MDHVYTNNSAVCSDAESAPVGYTDHNVIAVARKFKTYRTGPKVFKGRSYRKLTRDIEGIDWNQVLDIKDVDMAVK